MWGWGLLVLCGVMYLVAVAAVLARLLWNALRTGAALPRVSQWTERWPIGRHETPEPELVGLIVEPRLHRNLLPVIENVRRVLPGLPLTVVHGLANEAPLRARFGDTLCYWPLPVDNLTLDEYNVLLTRPELYDRLWGQRVLVFQTDAVLFSRSAVKIETVWDYDFLGAPNRAGFPLQRVGAAHLNQYHPVCYNGGLSLRRRRRVSEALRAQPYLRSAQMPFVPEDVYIVQALAQLPGAQLPPWEVAARVFFEFVEGPELPLGAHARLPPSYLDQILPEEADVITGYGR